MPRPMLPRRRRPPPICRLFPPPFAVTQRMTGYHLVADLPPPRASRRHRQGGCATRPQQPAPADAGAGAGKAGDAGSHSFLSNTMSRLSSTFGSRSGFLSRSNMSFSAIGTSPASQQRRIVPSLAGHLWFCTPWLLWAIVVCAVNGAGYQSLQRVGGDVATSAIITFLIVRCVRLRRRPLRLPHTAHPSVHVKRVTKLSSPLVLPGGARTSHISRAAPCAAPFTPQVPARVLPGPAAVHAGRRRRQGDAARHRGRGPHTMGVRRRAVRGRRCACRRG